MARRAASAVNRIWSLADAEAAFKTVAQLAVGKRRRFPPVPSQTVALEPEQQVGSAVAATGLPPKRPCSNAADSARPRGKDLGSKGIQVSIEHCRKRQFVCLAQYVGYYV